MANVTATRDNCLSDSLYQWDHNQELVIFGLRLAAAPEVHFAHDGAALATVRQATLDQGGVIRVEVPNSLLQTSGHLNAYVYTEEGDPAKTVRQIVIPVIARAQPSDWEGEDEVEVYQAPQLAELGEEEKNG